ncbi:MAG TPA: MBL fold metallo-hydrolase [Ktedonobacteraceae bacterium]|nr:MBL fold metallo-hydrolase [Ktedonobacteraceae bacterium]
MGEQKEKEIVEIVLPRDTGEVQPDMEHGSVYFIGTATVLFRYAGFMILTDPNFLHKGEQAHIGYGLRSTRLTDPAINIDQLPPLDLVVLSHMHEDHFDRTVQRKLDKLLPIVTNPKAAEALKKKGFSRTYAINTWESLTVMKGDATLRITALPARHAPALAQFLMPPVMGSMLEFQSASHPKRLSLYISGDTVLYDQLREIPRHFEDIDLALLHLGGVKIMGLLLTMNGKQGAQAVRIIAPKIAIPVHFNDYKVFKSPLDDFKQAVREAGLESKVKYLKHGETYIFDVPVESRT